ncbi:MAG: glycyl-radical enzyme activating protein [Anaerolineaceae bacterium]|nr:glycyl-radical enzyme activating protein [Anaerolineaceae bacterium]
MRDQTAENLNGVVLEIQRLSTEDGPGIRTTVFMKGCPMHCIWCHNPESIETSPQIQWIESRCIGCQSCLSVCQQTALQSNAEGILIDRQKCLKCGSCAIACPTNALELLGTTWSVSCLAKEMMKDSAFYQSSGGGITISGGESTLQYAFVSELLREVKEHSFHTAIDTCGIASRPSVTIIVRQLQPII